MNSIKRRLDRLERQVRRWRILGCAAAGLIAVPPIMGTTGGEQIQVADKIRAKTRAVLGADNRGTR